MAGNQTVATRTITLDFAVPGLIVTAPADNSTVVGSVIDITGTIDTGSTVNVKVNGGTAQAASINGLTYSATVNLSSGMNTIEVIATDLAGKKNSKKRTVVSGTQGVTLQVVEPGGRIH